jgi:hypothetical protein
VLVVAQAGEQHGVAGPVDADVEHELRIAVGAPGHIHGVVVDARGVPVEGALVDATLTRFEDDPLPPAVGLRAGRAHTDPDGHFALDVPLSDAWTVTATRAGFVPATLTAVQVLGGDRELTLRLVADEREDEFPPQAEEDAANVEYAPALWLRETPEGTVVLRAAGEPGLLPGDRLVAVAGHAVQEGNPWEHLVGRKSTKVSVEVVRPATGQHLRFLLPRTESQEDEGC